MFTYIYIYIYIYVYIAFKLRRLAHRGVGTCAVVAATRVSSSPHRAATRRVLPLSGSRHW